MTICQLLGLHCRHKNLAVPRSGFRCCLDCGERFEFTSYTLTEEDKKPVAHVKLVERSINPVKRRALRWRKKA